MHKDYVTFIAATHLPRSILPAKNSLAQLKETGSAFEVEHECLGKCQGLFAPQFYVQPDAPCIQCLECCGMFAPQTFVMHSHRSPTKGLATGALNQPNGIAIFM